MRSWIVMPLSGVYTVVQYQQQRQEAVYLLFSALGGVY
jgi:hypothetical protein